MAPRTFTTRVSRSTHGEELHWRCSRCIATSVWTDGRCTDCGEALAEVPVLCFHGSGLEEFLRIQAVFGDRWKVAVACPACSRKPLVVEASAERHRGREGFGVRAWCAACRRAIDTLPSWMGERGSR